MAFDTFEEAIAVFEASEPDSPEWREALAYAVVKAPPPLKQIFNDLFREFFPELKPDYFDEDGVPYYATEKVKKHFGLSQDEIDGMKEGCPEITRSVEGLIRVQ